MDNQQEIFPIVNENGKVVGSATRGECHSGSKLLHPVVHLHVFNSKGDIYLQKRPEWKDIQPGKWDTAVGGHIDYGETPEDALRREVKEELGITDFTPEFVDKYVFESKRERELVYVNRTTYDGEVHPSTDELDGGRFWTMQEIREAMGKGVLTPNFESEFRRCFGERLQELKQKEITAAYSHDEQLKQLYQTAFPENEQIPWADLMRLIDQMSLDFTAYYEDNKLIGFTIVYPRPSFNWYWYFAVREELRGKGYGQQILSLLIEKYRGQACVLDMESPCQDPCPNPEQRKRRHGFYHRNGFRDTNVYRSYGDITMTVMMMGPGTFTLQDWDDITNELKQYWWPTAIGTEIKEATKEQAPEIARLIMMAMTDECCLYFCGEGYGLVDFRKMMTALVEREDSQYSYRNTIVAMDGNKIVGISVSYDGSKLHELRRPFVELALKYIGKDHSSMDDETQAGELYLDSLAVIPEYRRQGIASRLIKATKERADRMGLPCVGLLVDKGNPNGEALYASVGFQYANDSHWGGHDMKHLIL